MVQFVGVVLVVVMVVVVMVLVVVRDRAREMGVPKRGWRTQLGSTPSFTKTRRHLQRNQTEQRFYPWRHIRKQDCGSKDDAANAQNNRKQLERRVGRHTK